jgi:acyl-CoA dehydrogenase
VRADIAAVKAAMPRALHAVASRAVQIHGALGVSNEMPLAGMVLGSMSLGIADGPTEVHKVTLAREVLSRYQPAPGLFPTAHIPARREAAIAKYAEVIEQEVVAS